MSIHLKSRWYELRPCIMNYVKISMMLILVYHMEQMGNTNKPDQETGCKVTLWCLLVQLYKLFYKTDHVWCSCVLMQESHFSQGFQWAIFCISVSCINMSVCLELLSVSLTQQQSRGVSDQSKRKLRHLIYLIATTWRTYGLSKKMSKGRGEAAGDHQEGKSYQISYIVL